MASGGLPPLIAAQLNYLLNHHSLDVKVEQMWSGNKCYPGVLDRFTIAIPFCLDVVKWDVMYNADSPMSAPDIIFGPEDESFHPFSAKSPKNCSLLDDWNSRDPTRLMALIQELRDRYVDYQRKRVGDVDDARLNFEISTIVFREGIEMALSSGAEKPEEVKFAVPITDMKIDRMVPGCPWRGPPKIYLQVIYPVGKKHVTAPLAPRLKLVSSSELKSFFSIEDVKLPPWSDGMCMAEYLPHLEESLEKQILEAVSLIDVRRRFIEALVPQFGWPLEADPVFCRKATFLAGSGVFTFLVHFMISTQFPKQQPALMLHSCQHLTSQGVPIKSSLMTEYPWSPRWETPQMAERICEFLADEALNFKRHCNESQLQH
ncbi:hypothetical protein F2P56_025310 [Juglans regia]|uniref:BRISC and BRCA1-A complex member 2 n=2 Tax=Juglans regia TaxID=51240 RepID=A0A2I4FP81_JUGRE|nr:BRISC and BRCA1-A complex member 2 [Juglans regia]KAF5455764.1 hypothetical protein F2P56_025310 [Juglans regia]